MFKMFHGTTFDGAKKFQLKVLTHGKEKLGVVQMKKWFIFIIQLPF